MTNVFKSATATFFFCILPMSLTAHADPAPQASVKVAYGDLDLSSLAGAKAMLGRLRIATRQICGDTPHPSQLSAVVRHKTCSQSAMSRAVATLDHPTVSAVYAGRQTGAQTAAR